MTAPVGSAALGLYEPPTITQQGTLVTATSAKVPVGPSTLLGILSVLLHLAATVAAVVVLLASDSPSERSAALHLIFVTTPSATLQGAVLTIVRGLQAKSLTQVQAGLQKLDTTATGVQQVLSGPGTTPPSQGVWSAGISDPPLASLSAATG